MYLCLLLLHAKSTERVILMNFKQEQVEDSIKKADAVGKVVTYLTPDNNYVWVNECFEEISIKRMMVFLPYVKDQLNK